MKKLLFLFLTIGLLTACSEDDETSNGDQMIVGTWFVVESENVPGYSVNECTGQSYITFNGDNTAESEFYTLVNGNCMSADNVGTWTTSSGSKYTFDLPNLGRVTGTVNFDGDSRFVFRPDDIPTSSLTFEK